MPGDCKNGHLQLLHEGIICYRCPKKQPGPRHFFLTNNSYVCVHQPPDQGRAAPQPDPYPGEFMQSAFTPRFKFGLNPITLACQLLLLGAASTAYGQSEPVATSQDE